MYNLMCRGLCAIGIATVILFTGGDVLPQPTHILATLAFGGQNDDNGQAIAATADGGFIIAGSSRSSDATIPGHHGNTQHPDFWVGKYDAEAQLQWQRSLGGSSYDEAHAITQTSDGGYIVCGESRSSDGDVADHHGSTDFEDAWGVKLDRDGRTMWARSYGGSDADIFYAAVATDDGGAVFGGMTQSVDGDVIGRTRSSDNSDAWVVRVNADGEIAWQHVYGGTDNDDARALILLKDGSLVFTGSTHSSDGDVSVSYGRGDMWITRLDAGGNMLWNRVLGGSGEDCGTAMCELSDGRLAIAGYSYSDDGSLHNHYSSSAFSDAWIVFCDDAGTVQSNFCYGGSRSDASSGIVPFQGGCIAAGWSESHDEMIVDHHGGTAPDGWVFGVDSTGGVNWNFSVGTPDADKGNAIARLSDGRFVLTGSIRSPESAHEMYGQTDVLITMFEPARSGAPVAIIKGEAHPNPFTTSTMISIPPSARVGEGGVLEITDVNGRPLFTIANITSEEIEMDRGSLRSGTYFFRILHNGALIAAGRLEIQP